MSDTLTSTSSPDGEIDTTRLRARYETVKYTSRVYRLTHPDRLAMVARLRGLVPPDVATARVLEIGCGSGANIVAMAHHVPGASFLGVDLSDTIMEEGRAAAVHLGLDNLTFLAAPVEALPDVGTFDYIISHGVYSWITDEARRAMLDAIRRHLAPNGVAYVSYNALPGWYYRLQTRDILRWHGERFEEPETQIEQGRLMLDFIIKGIDTDVSLYGRLLKRTAENLDESADAYVFHDYYAPINRPLYVTEFLGSAAAASLQYLGEADHGEVMPARMPQVFHEALKTLEDEPVRFQQLIDHIRCAGFRRTLLTHEQLPLTVGDGSSAPAMAIAILTGTELLMQSRLKDGVDFDRRKPTVAVTRDELEVTTNDPIVKAALFELESAYPTALGVETLFVQARARMKSFRRRTTTDFGGFCVILVEFFALGIVDVLPRHIPVVTQLSEHPRANRLARWEATRGDDRVSNAYLERVEAQNVDRVLLRAADGTRDLQGIAEAVADAVRQGELVLHVDEQVTLDPELVLDVAREVTMSRLSAMASVGLLDR